MMMRKFGQIGTLGALTAFFAVFLILPVLTVIEQGLRWPLLSEIFTNFIYLEGLLNSLLIAVVTTLMVFAISLPLALIYDRFDFPLKNWTFLAVMAPMILPPFVGALGFQQLLGHYGILNTLIVQAGGERLDFLGGPGKFWSVCFMEALHLYPILYLNLVTALGNIDPALDEAGANLGAGKFYRFRRITMPLLKPGMLAGGSIVLVWSFTELGTPLMFGYNRTTAVQIFNGITELESNPLPYALVVVMLLFSAGLYSLSRLALGGGAAANMSKGIAGSAAVKLRSWRRFLPTLGFAALAVTAILPHIALVFTAFSRRWYDSVLPYGATWMHVENALSNKIVVPSIINSLHYSILAMLFALVIGLLISIVTVRWRCRGSSLIDLASMLPLAVPGIVIAFGYLGMATKYDWARHFFDPELNPVYLLAAAYAIRRLPYVVRSVSAGLEQTPVDLEQAARNLGAGAWATLRKITLPLISANLVVGGLFAFSFSMLEVSDSLILAQKAEFYPITKAIFELSQILGSGPYVACAFGVWAMLFLAATLAAAGSILGRRVGAIFKF
ncbi:MAG: ABC transporter permease [Victivallaceae bacterium]